jgi:hypothetical protein
VPNLRTSSDDAVERIPIGNRATTDCIIPDLSNTAHLLSALTTNLPSMLRGLSCATDAAADSH